MAKRLLRFLNHALSLAVGIALAAAVLYAGYALWDNWQIVRSGDNPLTDMAPSMTEFRPEEARPAEAEAGGEEEQSSAARTGEEEKAVPIGEENQAATGETPQEEEPAASAENRAEETQTEETQEEQTELEKTFIRLKGINPDIGAWITVPGTNINYAVVQGKNNIEYLSKDIYGNFAIVGSIYLDSRNKEDYSDTYNLLYGHNMSEHRMFSDVNLFKDEKFFNENQKAYIYFPSGAHWLQTVSVILTNAGDSWIMNPRSWEKISDERMLELVQKNAVFVSEEGMEALEAKLEGEQKPVFVALSTCSNEFTDARTILLMLMDPYEGVSDNE